MRLCRAFDSTRAARYGRLRRQRARRDRQPPFNGNHGLCQQHVYRRPHQDNGYQPYTYVDGDPVNLFDPTGHGIAGDDGGSCGNALDCTITNNGTGGGPGSNSKEVKNVRDEQRIAEQHQNKTISKEMCGPITCTYAAQLEA